MHGEDPHYMPSICSPNPYYSGATLSTAYQSHKSYQSY